MMTSYLGRSIKTSVEYHPENYSQSLFFFLRKQCMEPTARALARTYSDRVYPDPWEKVEDYQRVQAYSAEHPTAGRTAVGRALDLPPERVRGWINGGQPDPVRGINTASGYDWIEPDDKMAGVLVELLAHTLSGGSIDENFVPAISTGRRVDCSMIVTAFEAAGVGAKSRHADSDRRATEVYPSPDASVLGRCLVTMGAPRGKKTPLEAVPSIVWNSPEPLRRRFVECYVRHRGIHFETKATTRIQEERPESYITDLYELINESVSHQITRGKRGITISADAARELGLN